ncbi:hypothetical protein RintRC_2328 [Richelia intracellularis]|nr:hypothetical protein RintRC_2328 [Richelia intracellularis]
MAVLCGVFFLVILLLLIDIVLCKLLINVVFDILHKLQISLCFIP